MAASLAKVGRLTQFDDLDLIDSYASRFGMDPDYVYDNTSFETIISFATKWKEESEYRERFQMVWEEITAKPKK